MNNSTKMDFQLSNSGWNFLRVTLNWAYDGAVMSQYLKQSHYVEGQSAFLIRNGALKVTTDKGTVDAGEGQWVFPKEGVRILEFSPGTTILSMNFNLSWAGEYSMFSWDVAGVCDADQVPELECRARELISLLEDRYGIRNTTLLTHKMGLRDHFLIRQHFYNWLLVYLDWVEESGRLMEHLEKVDPRLLRIVRYLDGMSWHDSFRESDIAEKAGLSVSQSHRIFLNRFGCTPREYREGRRLEQALVKLQNTCEPMKKIAYELGFSSQSHFSSWLRKKTNCSPKELRDGTRV
jgi:AraC-like DNA-binding protein